MSSRALRKLQQEKELNELPGDAPSDDDVSIIRPASSSRAKMPNPFDLVSFHSTKLTGVSMKVNFAVERGLFI